MKDQLPLKKMLTRIGLLLAGILCLNQLSGPMAEAAVRYVFTPLQTLRCFIFHLLPFSLGDLFYLLLALYIFYAIVKLFRNRRKRTKAEHLRSGLKSIQAILFFYLALMLLWGLNYERPKLARQLALDTGSVSASELFLFDSFLINRLNTLQPQYAALSFDSINCIAARSYKQQETPMQVSAKGTFLGSNLAYFGIEGYFNPFTGEAQVDKENPAFMQPFVVAHEMAHQTGIAAEDDANLLAYIRSVESGNKIFEYSACLNIWFYTHRRVRSYDSTRANILRNQLNAFSIRQLDTLRERRIRYQTGLDDLSTFVFDLYLRMGKQKDGISSYRNVAYSAFCWEKKKRMLPDGSIRFF